MQSKDQIEREGRMKQKTGRKLTNEQKAKLREISWFNHNQEFIKKLATNKKLADEVREFIKNFENKC